jgi:hypothetical protein
VPAPTDPDPGLESRRKQLLERGDPNVMKPAPVVDQTKAPPNPADLLKVISRDVMQVGAIKVDLAKGTADIPVTVAAPSGPLEYAMVAPGGKAYESVLKTTVTAIELRFALTLLGFEGTPVDAHGKLPAATPADTVMASVRIGSKTRPLADLMLDQRTQKPVKDAPWQVVGFADADRDAALRGAELMTVITREEYAPLRYTLDAGNPYVRDQGLVANKATLPPPGTELTLVLSRRPDAPPPKVQSPGRTP